MGKLARSGAGEEHGGCESWIWRLLLAGNLQPGCVCVCVCVAWTGVCACVCMCVCEACTLLRQDESGGSRGRVSFSLRPVPP